MTHKVSHSLAYVSHALTTPACMHAALQIIHDLEVWTSLIQLQRRKQQVVRMLCSASCKHVLVGPCPDRNQPCVYAGCAAGGA